MIYLDTNIVVWLASDAIDYISQSCIDIIENSDNLCISPMVLLELDYLFEVNKITKKSKTVFHHLEKHLGLGICEKPFKAIIEVASKYQWTRDPFDRIITAHAALDEGMLLTKDAKIRTHYKHAIW